MNLGIEMVPKARCEWKEKTQALLLAGTVPPALPLQHAAHPVNILSSAPSLCLPSPLPAEGSQELGPRAAVSMGDEPTGHGQGKGSLPAAPWSPTLSPKPSFPSSILHLLLMVASSRPQEKPWSGEQMPSSG